MPEMEGYFTNLMEQLGDKSDKANNDFTTTNVIIAIEIKIIPDYTFLIRF